MKTNQSQHLFFPKEVPSYLSKSMNIFTSKGKSKKMFAKSEEVGQNSIRKLACWNQWQNNVNDIMG